MTNHRISHRSVLNENDSSSWRIHIASFVDMESIQVWVAASGFLAANPGGLKGRTEASLFMCVSVIVISEQNKTHVFELGLFRVVNHICKLDSR